MLRFGTLLFALLTFVSTSLAADYRLVIASDEAQVRQSAAMAVFDSAGHLTKSDRITSITFSAGESIKPNCLVTLDTSGAKNALALGPEVQIYQGKVLIAGQKPTKKVIPAFLSLDTPAAGAADKGKLNALVQPIIQQVYNLPWMYIGIGVGIVLLAVFFMNRRSHAYTTTMSKEAKSLYLETVKSIVDRLDKIEASQHQLVKNPPVIRSFRAQIEGFDARLTRMEKHDKEAGEILSKAASDLERGAERHGNLLSSVEASRVENAKWQTSLAHEVQAVKGDLAQFAKMQIAIREDLAQLTELQAQFGQLAEKLQQIEPQLQSAEARSLQNDDNVRKQLAQVRMEIADLQTAINTLPDALDSIRQAMPSTDALESKLDSLKAPIEEIRTGVEAMPVRFDGLAEGVGQIHESILRQIGEMSHRHEESDLERLSSVHVFESPAPDVESEIVEEAPEAEVEVVDDSADEELSEPEEVTLPDPEPVVLAIEETPHSESAPVEEAEIEPDTLPTEPTLWTSCGGTSARTWSSVASSPLRLENFDRELKPMTPIGTAPIGNEIESPIYAGGRVVYACGANLHGFWPGRDDRQFGLDENLPKGGWRLAAHGNNLFVAEKKRVRILNAQGWYTLEQFVGEYLDQLTTPHRWIGLRNSDGAVLDFRDHRGHIVVDGLLLHSDVEGLRLCANESQVFAGTPDGRILEVSEQGVTEIARGPEGMSLRHLCVYQSRPLAIFTDGTNVECVRYGPSPRAVRTTFGSPDVRFVLVGNDLHLADPEQKEMISISLHDMAVSRVPCFGDVAALRRFIGVRYQAQSVLFALSVDEGRPGGRVLTIDPSSGRQTQVSNIGQSQADLIVADHQLVLATSSEYQNVIRVMEPFAARIAA